MLTRPAAEEQVDTRTHESITIFIQISVVIGNADPGGSVTPRPPASLS